VPKYALALTVVVAVASCTTESVTYTTRPPFNPPPDQAAGFLGYFSVSTRQTTCGNCHVGHQGNWVNTRHAHAWQDLQASGQAQASCNNCHSLTQLGNGYGKPAGYAAVPDSAYHDVQCESCHGAGYTHVQNPEVVANQPLASIHVDTGLTKGCGGCHTGVHAPFVDQWVQSAHGSGPGFAAAVGNSTCTPCHEGKTAMLVKFGETENYLEKSSATPERIVCAVCHNPHGSPYQHQLRAPISTPTIDNLCVRCHSRSATPPWGTASGTSPARGPHGAQGLLVIGLNVGWIPPGFQYDTNEIVSSHGTEANPDLCATCHVVRTTVTDNVTGAFKFQSVGHLFAAIPCLDANGIPTIGDCAQAQRDFSGCVASGCHANTGSAITAYNANIATLDILLDQIWKDNNGNGIVDPSPTDGGLIAQMVARSSHQDSVDLDFGNTITSVAKGTLYNAALAATDDRPYFLAGTVYGKSWAAHTSSGNGVHNPFLLQALLSASITALHQSTGFPVPPAADLSVHATPPPSVLARVRAQP
jgi:predicted CXXCH cytochrome family protein